MSYFTYRAMQLLREPTGPGAAAYPGWSRCASDRPFEIARAGFSFSVPLSGLCKSPGLGYLAEAPSFPAPVSYGASRDLARLPPGSARAGSRIGEPTWQNGTARSLSFRAGGTLAIACACATWPRRSIFIDVRRAADGWMATILARCSTMKGHYRIRPTIGVNAI